MIIPPVGQPREGDPRAAYVVEEAGRLTVGQAEYDVERTVEALEALGLPPQY